MSSISFALLSKTPIFKHFLTASTVSLFGTSIFDIAIPLYIWDRTHSPMALAFGGVALHLPYFLTAPFTGYFVDHFNNRKLMLLSDIGQIFTLLFVLAYDFSGASYLWPVLAAVFIAKSLSIQFETVATFHLIPAIVPRDKLGEANTWFLSTQRLIQVVGPVSGGLLMSLVGFRLCILINILSFSATLLYVIKMKNLAQLIREDIKAYTPRKPVTLGAIFQSFHGSLKYIWTSPLFKPFIFAMFFWNLSSLTPQGPSLVYYFRGLMGYSEAQFGLVVSLCGALSIVGFLTGSALYRRFGFYRAFAGSGLWQAFLGTASIGFLGNPLFMAAVFGSSRLGSSCMSMGSFYLRQTKVPRLKTGAVNASIRMHFMSAAPLSALLQGVIIQHLGVEFSLLFGAICLWITLWYAIQVALAYEQGNQQDEAIAA